MRISLVQLVGGHLLRFCGGTCLRRYRAGEKAQMPEGAGAPLVNDGWGGLRLMTIEEASLQLGFCASCGAILHETPTVEVEDER